jgi:Ran GTPase-activating protein (RanGAP) involved in mRNA processing and transport
LFKKIEESVEKHFYVNDKPLEMTEFNLQRKERIIEHIIEYMAFLVNKLILEPEITFQNKFLPAHWSKYSLICNKITNKTKWEFFNKRMDKAGFHVLSKILSFNQSLKSILIRGCKIDDSDLTFLFQALPYNNSLESIDLQYNMITNEGMKQLSNFLVSNKGIKCINFSHNTGITSEGLQPLVNVSLIENTTLKTLFLSGLNLRDEDAPLITKIFTENRGLERIVLSHNAFTADALKDWKKSLKVNKNIQCLDLTANPIGQSGGSELIDIIKTNKIINNLVLRGCSFPPSWNKLSEFVEKHSRKVTIEMLGN